MLTLRLGDGVLPLLSVLIRVHRRRSLDYQLRLDRNVGTDLGDFGSNLSRNLRGDSGCASSSLEDLGGSHCSDCTVRRLLTTKTSAAESNLATQSSTGSVNSPERVSLSGIEFLLVAFEGSAGRGKLEEDCQAERDSYEVGSHDE